MTPATRLTGRVSLASEMAGSMPRGSRSLLRDVRELILGVRSQRQRFGERTPSTEQIGRTDPFQRHGEP